ncbi:MAG: AAA family ATPase [Candidatus Micrarchaeota archaeon]
MLIEEPKIKTVSSQKLKAQIKILQEDENFWHAFFVFIGSLAILFAVPFYPFYIIPLLAILCGAIAYRNSALGTILGVIFVFPAFVYQSYSLGFLFMLITAIVLFEAFEHWDIICALEVLIFLPFTPFPVSLLGGFVMLGMVITALNFGSSKSILISIPSVFLILFLSSIWLYPNSAYMPIVLDNYSPKSEALQFSKSQVSLSELPQEFFLALASLANFSKATEFGESLSKSSQNIYLLFLNDSCFIQLVSWSIILYLISVTSARRGNHTQFFSSLFLLFVPLVDYFISASFNLPFRIEIIFYTLASIAIVCYLEMNGINFSKEGVIRKKELLKRFGKFGVQDLSLESKESFADVGGYEDVKDEIRDAVVLPLEQKDLAYAYGLTPPKGILLFGPPGTGKTMIIRALANEIDYRLYYVNTSELLSKWYGESEKNVAELFNDARKNAPCIIMFDEIDTVGKNRSAYTDDVTPRVLSVLLQEIDGAVNSGKPIMIIGTTNIPNTLDPALLRPGRFDKIIYMPLPNFEARKAIFGVYLRKYNTQDVDFDKLAKQTERFSGADIKNVIDEAVKRVAKEAQQKNIILPIHGETILNVVSHTKPSVSLAHLEDYENFKMDFERRVGAEKKRGKEKEGKDEGIFWRDVVGLESVKEALLEAIQLPLLHEDLMKKYKVKPNKGILLFGPPGCGKTLIVRAAASELSASFIILSGAELMKKGYSQAVSVLKTEFLRAKENIPTILFIDEIETVVHSRTISGGDIVGQLLTEMDGIKELKGVVVVGATNRPDMLDPAILRPGRFDKIFYIPPPDINGRKEIFKINLGEFASGVDLDLLAQDSEDFSGADISSVVQTAKMDALREKLKGTEPKIATNSLLKIIHSRKPSITTDMLDQYAEFMSEYGERR